MLRIGLSGGIGSGKSTVAQRFSELGATVIDADVLAREVVEPGSEGLRRIAERFGDDVLDDSGALNRAALGAVVFADGQARRDLEGITHPLIAQRTAALVAAAPEDAVVVHDVPLLVEKHYGPGYHLVVVVGAEAETRVRRLMRRGMTEADARSRIAAQATDEQRRGAADVWLDNSRTREDLLEEVDALWRGRLVAFEHNVRHRAAAHRPETLELVPSDPTWPAQAERLLERVRRALGDLVVDADHVGSTAIPGMPAKDVIDLQVGVTSLAAVDGEEARARLDDAGFPRVDGVDADVDRGSGGGSWPKRMHGNADPGRVAHIHLRAAGSPGWRWALMFRDWMRHDEQAAAEYAAEKARILATGASTSAYAVAKEPWFDAMASRGQEWASQTGWEPRHG